MQRILTCIVALTAGLGLLLFVGEAMAQPDQLSGLIVTTVPGGEEEELIVLSVDPGATALSVPLYVRQPTTPSSSASTRTTPAALEGVRLFVYLAKDGRPLTDVTATFTENGPAIPETGFTVPAGGRQIEVTMNLANLNQTGVFTGFIGAEVDGEFAQLVTLQVSRTATPTLRVIGAGDSNSLHYIARKQNFSERVIIESQNPVDVETLKVLASFINLPEAAENIYLHCQMEMPEQPGTVRKCEEGASLPALGALVVHLTATLPVSGTYTGNFSLVYSQTRQPLSLTVQRVIPQLPITVHAAETAQGTADDVSWWMMLQQLIVDRQITLQEIALAAAGNVSWWMTLQETGQREAISLYQPAFFTFTRLDSNQQTYQAGRVDVRVNSCGSQEPIVLHPGEIRETRMVICGLRSPGRYTGQLTLSADGYRPLQTPVSVVLLVREHWWRAVLFISLGVAVSFFIRTYQDSTRPRLVSTRLALRLLADIEDVRQQFDHLHPDEASILNAWQRRLEKLQDDLDLGEAQHPDRILQEIDQKLTVFQEWLDVRRQLATVKRTLDPGKAEDFRQKLTDVTNYLKYPAQDDNAEQTAQTHRTALANLKRDIEAAVRQQMLEAVKAFRESINSWAKAQQQEGAVRDLVTNLEAVEKQITDAQSGQELARAQTLFDEVREAYAHQLAQWLKGQLQILEQSGPPPGFDNDNPWGTFKSEISNLLTRVETAEGAAAITAYEQAYRAYLRGMINALEKAVQDGKNELAEVKKNRLGPNPSESDSVKFTSEFGVFEEKLPLAEAAVDEAQKQAKDGDLAALEQAYKIALEKWNEAREAWPKSTGTLGGMRDLPKMLGIALGNVIPSGLPVSVTPGGPDRLARSFDYISRRLKLTDVIIQLTVIVITIFVGTLLLWGNNATWGGAQDYLTALLWGLGLHQVAGAAFQSTADLTQRLLGNRTDSSPGNAA